MRAAWYERQGPAREVLTVGELPTPEAGPGEVRVRVSTSGVNPSDVKRRSGWGGQRLGFERIVPHSDGAGVIDQVGEGVDESRMGERVWVYCAQWQRPNGTAAEWVVLPARQAVPLPDRAGWPLGACLGIPGMTAHRCLFADGPVAGKTVLVTGGAGSVGFSAVQLARWAGATVIATVSSPEKGEVAARGGAHHVIDYRREDVVGRIGQVTEGAGVDRVVEVDLGRNLQVIEAVLRPQGVVASYASMSRPEPILPFYALMRRNVLLRLVYVYEVPVPALLQAASDLGRAVEAGAFRPHVAARFPLERVAEAHEAVERGELVGNVVVEVGEG